MFVYMQCVDKATKKPVDKYRRRGETGPNDDPEGFSQLMKENGLNVILAEIDLGTFINSKKEAV